MSEGWFTGVKLSDCTNYRDMRKVVNGMDRADLIAGYAAKFEAALLEAEAMPPRPDVEPVQKAGAPAWTWFADALVKIADQFTRKWRL